MSTEMKNTMRRIKRPSRWEQVGIKQEVVEKISRKRVSSGPWMQDGTIVTSRNITLEVGSRIIGYEANGIYDWYILGAEEGRLLITTKSCPEEVELKGREGYTNGVEILNNVAKKYTNSIYADGIARSINVEDVNRVTGYNPETAGYGANRLWQYGNEVTFYWDGLDFPYYSASNGVTGNLNWRHGSGFYYPKADGFNCSQKSTTASRVKMQEIAKLTSTYYRYYLLESSAAYQLLVGRVTYWLGSQYVVCDSYYAYWGLRFVYADGFVYGNYLANSIGDEDSYSMGLRPVVSLKSEVKVDSNGNIAIYGNVI